MQRSTNKILCNTIKYNEYNVRHMHAIWKCWLVRFNDRENRIADIKADDT